MIKSYLSTSIYMSTCRMRTNQESRPTRLGRAPVRGMTFTSAQDKALLITAIVSSTVSMCASLAIIISYYFFLPRVDRKQIGNRMVLIASILDFILSLACSLGRSQIPKPGEAPSRVCLWQAFTIQACLSAVVWLGVMAVNFYLLTVKHYDARSLRRLLVYEVIAVVVACTALAFVLLGLGLYGDAGLWCWIAETHPYAIIGCFYTVVFATWVVSVYCLLAVQKSGGAPIIVVSHPYDSDTSSHDQARGVTTAAKYSAAAVSSRLSKYLGAFLFIWLICMLNRIIGAVRDNSGLPPLFATNLLAALLFPSEGTANMLIYFGFIDDALAFLRDRCFSPCVKCCPTCCDKEGEDHDESGHDEFGPGIVTASTNGSGWRDRDLRPSSGSQKSIYVSTFNMGEAPLDPAQVPLFMPPGFDIYAIGTQECIQLPAFRAQLLEYLNSFDDRPFVMATSELGSANKSLGYHGFISLTVFYRGETGQVKMGAVPVVAMGRALPGGARAQNKGGCGLTLKLGHTSVTFINAHLSSDSGGKLRYGLRNANAASLLQSLVAASSDVGSDVQLGSHHTFVFGDLNYRIADFDQPELILKRIQEASSLNLPSWRGGRWNTLASGKSSIIDQESGPWDSLLEHDELLRARAAGAAFYAFKEPAITFPPSFRRVRKVSAGDYSSIELLNKSYTIDLKYSNEAEEEEEELEEKPGVDEYGDFDSVVRGPDGEGDLGRVEAGVFDCAGAAANAAASNGNEGIVQRSKSSRPPSWTDRILHYSMPDLQDRLQILAYDMADDVDSSDHRPVALSAMVSIDDSQGSAFRRKKPRLNYVRVSLTSLNQANLETKNEQETRLEAALYNTAYYKPRTATKKTRGKVNLEHKKSGSSPHVCEFVEFIFPLPSEDPFADLRSVASAASESLGTYTRPRAGDAHEFHFKNGFGEDLSVPVAEVASNMRRMSLSDLASGGLSIVSQASPSLGLHAIIKLVDIDGVTMAAGLVCLRDVAARHMTEDAQSMDPPEAAVSTRQRPTPVLIEVDMVLGGQFKGSISLEVTCEKLVKSSL